MLLSPLNSTLVEQYLTACFYIHSANSEFRQKSTKIKSLGRTLGL